jgi:hypothetical protein
MGGKEAEQEHHSYFRVRATGTRSPRQRKEKRKARAYIVLWQHGYSMGNLRVGRLNDPRLGECCNCDECTSDNDAGRVLALQDWQVLCPRLYLCQRLWHRHLYQGRNCESTLLIAL